MTMFRRLGAAFAILALTIPASALGADPDVVYDSGTWFLSGGTRANFSFDNVAVDRENSGNTDTDHTRFGLGTKIGYFPVRTWEIGIALEYDYDRGLDDNDTIETTTDVMIGLQTLWFFPLDGIVDPYGGLTLGYNSRTVETEPEVGLATSDSYSGFPAYELEAGANIQLASGHVGLAPALYYRGYTLNGEDETSSTSADSSGNEVSRIDTENVDENSREFGFKFGVFVFLP
ncbi:MAG: outer membrane beta-barrel protein [Deltaproteobacteria bacterium]|nr:outer membrane beta-barrel protein [Deltaproteobacteria bacterium]